jgi:hypothetical protein
LSPPELSLLLSLAILVPGRPLCPLMSKLHKKRGDAWRHPVDEFMMELFSYHNFLIVDDVETCGKCAYLLL